MKNIIYVKTSHKVSLCCLKQVTFLKGIAGLRKVIANKLWHHIKITAEMAINCTSIVPREHLKAFRNRQSTCRTDVSHQNTTGMSAASRDCNKRKCHIATAHKRVHYNFSKHGYTQPRSINDITK